jgi:Skp family chaperone for outer membrane proteins
MYIVAAAAAIAAVSTAWNLAADPPAAAPAGVPTRVAVVDIVKVFNEFDQIKVLNQKMSALEADLQAQDQKKNQEIESQRGAVKAFSPDSPQHKKANDDLRTMLVNYQVWKLEAQDRMSQNHLRWVNRTYESIRTQVAAVAKAKGFQVILTTQELDTSITDSKVMLKQIIERKVLYFDPVVDLTADVLAALNNAFAAAGGARSVDVDK